MDRRTFMKQAAIGSIATGLGLYLPGCATSAKSTWECSGGVCIGKGIIITKIDEQKTEVQLDAKADQAAHNSRYFNSPLMTWTPAYSVGIKEMDEQHIKLIYIINALHDAMIMGNGDKVLGMIFNAVLSYTATHFADEEAMLASYNYPALASQHQEHENFVKHILVYRDKFQSGSALISMDVLELLKAWLENHLQKEDKKYGVYLNAKGIY